MKFAKPYVVQKIEEAPLMKLVTCPHCGHRHIVTSKIPRDVVVVLPCPSCQEFVVFFRDKTIGLKRDIIDNGSFEERKEHIAEVIAEFLEAGLPWAEPDEKVDASDDAPYVEESADEDGDDDLDAVTNPITQSEIDHFVKLELQRIDDASYFRRLFG